MVAHAFSPRTLEAETWIFASSKSSLVYKVISRISRLSFEKSKGKKKRKWGRKEETRGKVGQKLYNICIDRDFQNRTLVSQEMDKQYLMKLKDFFTVKETAGEKRQYIECEILAQCMSDQRVITGIHFKKLKSLNNTKSNNPINTLDNNMYRKLSKMTFQWSINHTHLPSVKCTLKLH